MNNVQLLLFPHAAAEIDAAIDTIREQRLPLPNHLHFVRELGASITSLRPGSVILAAAPCGHTTDEVCSWINDYLRHDEQGKPRAHSPQMAIVNTPLAPSKKLQRDYLAEAYRGALAHVRLTHIREKLILGDTNFLPTRDKLRVISGDMAQRPADYYILRDAHNFQRPGAPAFEAQEQVRFVVELAKHSGRTQVLLGRVTTICEWMKDPVIAEAATFCMLRPYDLRNKQDAATFLGLLRAFDEVIPWAGGDSLLARVEQIDAVVWGSPQRLKKWALAALTVAKERGLQKLTWDCFASRQPWPAESEEAKAELKVVLDCLARGATMANLANTTVAAVLDDRTEKPKKKPRTPPGRCKPRRYTVGESAA